MANSGKKIEREIDRFNDIFHDFGDDADEQEDEYIDFDNLYKNIGKEDDIQINKDNNIIDLPTEEQRLSQKLSQLSTAIPENDDDGTSKQTTTKKRPSLTPTTATIPVASKKMKADTEELSNEVMPKYLSDSNRAFEQMINPVLQKTASVVNIEHLRHVALLIHKLALIDLNITLWSTYLRSGTGKLQHEENTNLFMWPEEVEMSMIDDGYVTSINRNEIHHDICVNYVHSILDKFRNESVYYRNQLEERKQRLNNRFTWDIEETIVKFVEQYGTALLRISTEEKLATVDYDYKDRLIQLEYQQTNPNEYQLQVFNDLTQTKYSKEQFKLDVAILKQRFTHNHLPDSFDSLQIPPPISLTAIKSEGARQRLIDRCEKSLKRTKTDMMAIYIATAEVKMDEYRMKFDTDMAQMKQYQQSGAPHEKLTEKITFFRQSSDGHELDLVHRRSDKNNPNIGCSPTITQAATHHLSYEQLAFLNRGPTYVSPCQAHVSSTSESLDEIIMKQIAPLRRQLTKLFNKYKVDVSRRWNFEEDIKKQFIKSFSVPIPSSIQERALYEKQLIRSIRYQIKEDRLILRRTADDNNTYYLGRLDEFNRMADEYIQNSICYELIGTIGKFNSEEQQLTEIIKSIDLAVDKLQQKRLIPKDYSTKLQIGNKANINLPYLYFLPEIHQGGYISVRPRFSSCQHCPIYTLATCLEQLLQPLFESFSQSTTFINGRDFIQKLEYYYVQQDCRLLPTINFLTFKIHNLHIRVSHTDILTALNRFLNQKFDNGRHHGLTIDAVEALTAIVLQNNVFSYNGNIYRQIKGSPLNLPLTRLLFNIYLHNWQIPLVRQIRLADQFYGRYHDIGFMTWNGPRDILHMCFSELNEQHPDVQINMSTGSSVHFLNAYIENRKGTLYTRVHQNPFQQPFLLPYFTGHPRLIHRQWFRFLLIRAGQYCSSWEDFNEERLYIELTFLANGYSLDFVEYHLQQYFKRFNPVGLKIILNRWTYPSFRKRLFRCLGEQKLENKTPELIQLFYLFDWGSRCEFNQKFYKLWSTILNADPVFKKYGLQIKLNSKHCYSSNALCIQ